MAEKKKTGRPPIDFDLAQVEAFGYCKAVYDTMAHYFGCSVETIKNRMEDTDSAFYLAYKKGNSRLKIALSEAQIQLALSGNATLLIWLGKQYLGQADSPTQEDDSDFDLIDNWTK